MRFGWFMAGLVLLAGCGSKEEVEKEEVPTGYRGEARLNPYLAAERYLSDSGWSARSSREWSDFGEETGIIFMPASYLGSRGLGMRVLDWVSDGGVLVLTVEGGEPERNDFTSFQSGFGQPDEGDYPGLDYLLEETGVKMVTENWGEVSQGDDERNGHLSRDWHVARIERGDEDPLEVEFEGEIGFETETGWDWEENSDMSSRVVSTGYHEGAIVFLAHARPLRNPYLARSDHAAFLDTLVDWDTSGEVVFLYGTSTSFFGLIWQRAWMVVVAGGLLLLGWLWMRISRLGPILADDFQTRKPYGESLTASARFLWRGGHIEHLVRPVRARLESEHQGDPANFYQRLADQSGLTREEVAEALTSLPSKDPGALIQLVQKLQTLLKR